MQAAAGTSGTDAMEGWDSTDMDDFQEASSEVDGVPPSLHLLADPTIPVRVPVTQVQPTCKSSLNTLPWPQAHLPWSRPSWGSQSLLPSRIDPGRDSLGEVRPSVECSFDANPTSGTSISGTKKISCKRCCLRLLQCMRPQQHALQQAQAAAYT